MHEESQDRPGGNGHRGNGRDNHGGQHGHAGHQHQGGSQGDSRRIDAVWPWVRDQLDGTSGPVLEIGCGPLGGFVPALLAQGREALGVDPNAPQGAAYRRTVVEDVPEQGVFGAVVACTSLHHVPDLEALAVQLRSLLRPGGLAVVIEWAWERIDDATAEWSFARLGDSADSWLTSHRAGWLESGLTWDEYLHRWADQDGVLPGAAVRDALARHLETVVDQDGPYFFPYLAIGAAEEQEAIDAGVIQPVGIRWVGRAPTS